ncbi:MAG TPA: DUF4832 domain-containing protein [Planctomycetota bacterium]|nr:DUF4832 domain-containing protein [Planctomycetota bacterium]
MAKEVVNRVRPRESQAVLLNPHKGITTFQRFNGDPLYPDLHWSERGPTTFHRYKKGAPLTVPHYPPTAVAYVRWYWDTLEPKPGQYRFDLVEQSLKSAAERGQTLEIRFMPIGSGKPGTSEHGLPAWYTEKGGEINADGAPDFDSAFFFKHWGGLNKAFADRFDGRANLDTCDISFLGPWGEGAGKATRKSVDRMNELFVRSWKKTPLLTEVGGDLVRAASRLGTGWRWNCYGDLHTTKPVPPGGPGPGKCWCHHFDYYPQQIFEHGLAGQWQKQPVVFESCWVPMHWYQQGWDLDFIIQQGLKWHMSVFMPKSCAFPDVWLPAMAEFHKKMGYRFVVRQLLLPTEVRNGAGWELKAWIENIGVAPIYYPYDLALRLTQGRVTQIVKCATDVRKWLPGDVCLTEHFRLSGPFKRGDVKLHIALLDPTTGKPRVQFANAGTQVDGWLPVEQFTVV